jgi:short-subunit dehydrogenase
MEGLRLDLAGSGVAAATIEPGFLDTEMTRGHPGPMPFLLAVEPAVARIVEGLASGRATIAFPLPTMAVVRLLSALPLTVSAPLVRWGRRR